MRESREEPKKREFQSNSANRFNGGLGMSTAPETDIRSKVRETIETLPSNATWDDVMYRLYVRQKIEVGLKDAENGETVPVSEVRKRFGLPE